MNKETRKAYIATVSESLKHMGDEELELMAVLSIRILGGQANYGPFDVRGDQRNFLQEQLDEYTDACVYGAAQVLRQMKRVP